MDRVDSDWDAQIDEKSHLQEELTEPLLIVEKLSIGQSDPTWNYV
jgi:hypothetical protein